MKNPFNNNNDLTEIVFENRHKEYGAYQLRARYDKTMRKSLLVSVGTLVVLGLSALVFRTKADKAPEEIIVVTPMDGKKIVIVPDEKPEELKMTQKEELPPASTTKDTEMLIVKDKEVTEKDVVPTRDEMKEKIGGAETVENPEGDPNAKSLPIADNTGNGNGGTGVSDSEGAADKEFIHAEQMPEYEGGLQKMYKFIGRNLRYPAQAVENEVQGSVVVQFVVDKDGSVYNTDVLRGIGAGCDEEAMRVIRLLKFNPGKQNGRPVKVRFSLPIKFTLN